MFFGGEDEDQDFSLGGGGSKLASLFGMDKASSQGGNESLTYTAPKEPKKKKTGEASGSTPSVMSAAAVHAYKFVDGKYASQGKLGLALIANPGAADYKMLLYVTKQQQVTNARVTPLFKFTVMPNNYASFYDDAQQNWSVAFDGEQHLFQFAKQVALAKALNGGHSLDTVIDQDLPPLGEGGALELGDSVELKYSGWLLQGNTYGPVFDSNASAEKLLRFKVGKGKCLKALDEGCVGMKRGSKRMLVVPPQLGFGSAGQDKVPPNSTLIYEVEAVRVKLMKEKEGDSASTSSEPVTPALPAIPVNQPPVNQPQEADEDFKMKSKHISDQLTQSTGKSDKAKLISRMAKMGKPMLPMAGAIPAQNNSDDEAEDTPVTPATPEPVRPHIPAKPVASPGVHSTHTQPTTHHFPVHPEQAFHQAYIPPGQSMAHPMAQPMAHPMAQPMAHPMAQSEQPSPLVMQGVPQSSQLAVFQPQMPMQPPFQQFGQQPPQYNQMYAQQPQPQYTAPAPAPAPSSNQSDNSMPVLLSESRQQNTEVRLSLTRVSDKIDRMHERVEQMFSHQSSALALSSNVPNMETSALMNTVQRIVKENEQLKKDVLDKGAKIESQNEKISELLQRNQKYIEQSNVFLEERNDSFKSCASSSQAKVLSLEQEKVQLATELSATTSQMGTLQLEIASIRKRETEYRAQLESTLANDEKHRTELNSLKVQFTESGRQLEQSSKDLKEERQLRKQVESRLSSLQEEHADLTTAHSTAEKALAERKKKSSQEKKQLEEELEELRQQHEAEVTALKEKLKTSRVSTDVNTAQQVSQVEEELNQEWKEKCDRLLSTAQDKHQRELQELREEKAQVDEKLSILQEKMSNLKSTAGAGEKEVLQLKEEVDELKIWKQKYETLRNNATAFKERYEGRLAEVEQQREEAEEALQKVEMERDKAVDTARKALAAPAGGATAGGATGGGMDKDLLAAEVKKVMNSVYQQLRGQFSPEQKFSGKEVQTTILNTVKSVTLRMVQDAEKEEQAEEPEVMVAQSAAQTSSAAPPQKEKKLASEKAPITGDKGNIHYAEELRKAAEKSSKGLKPSTGHITGDKGNPYYAAELSGEAKSGAIVEAEEIAPQAAVMASSAAPVTSKPPKAKDEAKGKADAKDKAKDKAKVEAKDKDKAKEAHPTGDKGNILYTAELDKAGASQPARSPVKPTEAPVTGDKGNVHYTKELDKAAVPDVIAPQSAVSTSSAPPKLPEPEVIAPQKAATTSSATPTKPSAESKEKLAKESKEKAHITGDKGNPFYAEELKKAGVKKADPKLSAEKAHITGDRGNIHYAEELKRAAEGGDEKKEKESDKKSSEKAPTKEIPPDILSAIEKQILPGLMKEDKKDDKSKAEKKTGKKETADDLFGGDDDPLFSTPPSKKSPEKVKDTKKASDEKTPAKSKEPKKEQKKEQGDSDDGLKPKPPPLFGDDDDDDDLDWLS